jgi:metal-sulfur cluster biosynthetic enzyme/nitrite reductase/ring-hydroxylating ferredoxin subunit
MTATALADHDELASGERKSIFVDDIPALLIRLHDQYFAIEDVCSHDGQPLTDGEIDGGAIECPRHGARFDLQSGKPLCMPATAPIQTFAIKVRPEGIFAAVRTAGFTESTVSSSVQATPVTESVPKADDPATVTPAETAVQNSAAPVEIGDEAIIDALRQVIDPELMVNIVDLGLVYTVNHDNRKAVVEMTLTSPACPAGPQIVQQAKMVIERLEGIDEAQIKLTMSPPWTPDRMTDEARDQLGFF